MQILKTNYRSLFSETSVSSGGWSEEERDCCVHSYSPTTLGPKIDLNPACVKTPWNLNREENRSPTSGPFPHPMCVCVCVCVASSLQALKDAACIWSSGNNELVQILYYVGRDLCFPSASSETGEEKNPFCLSNICCARLGNPRRVSAEGGHHLHHHPPPSC